MGPPLNLWLIGFSTLGKSPINLVCLNAGSEIIQPGAHRRSEPETRNSRSIQVG